jgi:hypothetical protein
MEPLSAARTPLADFINSPLDNLCAGPSKYANGWLLPPRMFCRFLTPASHRRRHTSLMIVIERNQNHRVRAGIKGEPLGRTGLAVAHRLIHFRERLHVTAVKQRMDLLLQRRAEDQHHHLHRSLLHAAFVEFDRIDPGRRGRK